MVVTVLIVNLLTVKYTYFGSKLDRDALKPEIHLQIYSITEMSILIHQTHSLTYKTI